MDSNPAHTGRLDPSNPHHTDIGNDQQAFLGADALDPSSTSGFGVRMHSPGAGYSSQSSPWVIGVFQVPEYGLTATELDQFRRIDSLNGRQRTHEPTMSYTECNDPPNQGFMVPSEPFLGEFRPPEELAPFMDDWSHLLTGGGKEVFIDGMSNTHKDVRLTTGPNPYTETFLIPDYSSVPQKPPAQLEGYPSRPSGPALDLVEKPSMAPSHEVFSPGVCSEDIHRPLTSSLFPGRELSVDLLSSAVGHIGPASVTATSTLVGAPTEQCPSHAYPPKQGTGYVPLCFNGGPMTDAITASAPPRIALPTSKVQNLPSVRATRLFSSIDDPWVSRSPRRLPANSTPSFHSTRFLRRASTPDLSVDNLHDTANKECVYDIRMNLVEPRKRRALSAIEREETRKIRRKGVCGPCQKRKRRVLTVLCSMLNF